MMLTAFFEEMRKELRLTEPDFAQWLATFIEAAPDEPRFVEAMDAYASQLMRISQTAEMLGMPGLASWAQHVNQAAQSLATIGAERRVSGISFLAQWPQLADKYLAEPGNFDTSLLLAEYLTDAESPFPLSEADGIGLVEQLATPPVVPEELMEELAAADAPIAISEEDTSLQLRDDADQDVYQAFIDEAPGNVEAFSRLTHAIATGQATVDDFRNAKRIAHSFKGSANIVGIRGIAALGHHTEDILEHFEKSAKRPPRALGKTLVDASDCLAQMVGHLRGDEEAPLQSFQVLSDVVAWVNKVKSGEIDEIAEDAEVLLPAIAADAPAAASAAAPSEVESSLRVPLKTVDELFRLSSELTIKIGQLENRLKQSSRRAKSMLTQNLAVQQRVLEMEKLIVLRGLSLERAKATHDTDFDPLEMDRYNELHGAMRALAEVSADARELATGIEADIAQVSADLLQQTIVHKDLQHQILSTRMTPVSALAPRLVRNVRQTCQQTGKSARLDIDGGNILVDGNVLNKLADPLLHILRNAVDHGIEPPELRAALGKPNEGVVRLQFTRQGSTIVVTVSDDGRGLDFARIRDKAIERGLITPEAAVSMSEAELARLTLLPGFSTRDAVTEVSGRGVGMDVVASRLAELKGGVDLSSVTGEGSTVTLRFQASLVTQHALMVAADGQTLALPAHLVRQAVAAGLGEVVGEANGALTFQYRDRAYPLRDLAALVGFREVRHDPAAFASQPIVLVDVGGSECAVAADRVLDSRELIVKSMGDYLQHVHGVTGASLLGDGTVVPILNVAELVADPLAVSAAAVRMAEEARMQTRRVVVVDDSLSVRKSLIQLFEDAAFEVRAAGDGLEAIRVIDEFQPHAVCTDLEMPNMNGLELTQHLRQKDTTSHLPIVMITSRSMDKHREQAMRAGVDVYVTKPYVDADLLQKMHGVIGEMRAGLPVTEALTA
jgi:chemosensory pili system protein ChpA (sensor histidine kinase/response regulator)